MGGSEMCLAQLDSIITTNHVQPSWRTSWAWQKNSRADGAFSEVGFPEVNCGQLREICPARGTIAKMWGMAVDKRAETFPCCSRHSGKSCSQGLFELPPSLCGLMPKLPLRQDLTIPISSPRLALALTPTAAAVIGRFLSDTFHPQP